MQRDKKYVINLGRQLGSGGRLIGTKVAERLAIKFYDKSLLKLASEQSGLSKECFEKVDENTSRWRISDLVDFFRSQFSSMSDISGDVLGEQSLFQIHSDLIQELSEADSSLFVGRCADYILRNHPCSLNIFITADKQDRVKRISELHNLTEADAKRKIKEGDESRKAYYDYYTTKSWGDAASYDLCINSSRLGIDGTVDFIVNYVQQFLAV